MPATSAGMTTRSILSTKWQQPPERAAVPLALLLILRRRLRRRADVAPGIDGDLLFGDLVHRRLVVPLLVLFRLELVRGQFLFLALERRQRYLRRGGPGDQG